MRTRQVVLVVLGVLAVSTLALGTGGFSAASMDRGVHVSVVDNSHAFVSIWDPGANGNQSNPLNYHGANPVHGRETVTVLVVKNRLDRQIDISVANRASASIEVSGSRQRLSSGSLVGLDATVDCGSQHGLQKQVPLVLTVDSVQGGLSARINTSASIECGAQTPNGTSDSSTTQ